MVKRRVSEDKERWQRYEFIANIPKEFMTLINRDYMYEFANEAYCRAHNKQRSFIENNSVANVWGEETFNNIIKGSLDKCFAGSEVHYESWFEYIGQEPKCYAVSYYPYFNDKGEVTHVAVVSHDVTEHKRIEKRLKQTVHKLRENLGGIIQALSSAVEARDPYTAGHEARVSNLARIIGREIGLSRDTIDGIRTASKIHDVGKISIPAEILSKPTKLKDIEMSLIRIHSQVGYEVLKEIKFPWPISQIVLQHHEKLNGTGYPNGLKGNQILIEAKIISVADTVEAMSSHRPYRPALGIMAALKEIEKNKGILYDPEVVEVCIRLFREKSFSFE